MSICVETFSVDETGVCHIRLYRPVSCVTAITIIETPFLQSNLGDSASSHQLCTSGLHLISLMGLSGLLESEEPEYMFADSIPMSKECVEQQAKPAIRPISNIRRVVLVKGAHLHDHPPVRLSPIKTNLRLHNLDIKPSGSVLYKDILKTVFELMKLAAMQVNAKNLVEAEKKLIPEHEFGIASLGSSTCMLRLQYAEWHLNLVMTMSVAEQFVKKVCFLPLVCS